MASWIRDITVPMLKWPTCLAIHTSEMGPMWLRPGLLFTPDPYSQTKWLMEKRHAQTFKEEDGNIVHHSEDCDQMSEKNILFTIFRHCSIGRTHYGADTFRRKRMCVSSERLLDIWRQHWTWWAMVTWDGHFQVPCHDEAVSNYPELPEQDVLPGNCSGVSGVRMPRSLVSLKAIVHVRSNASDNRNLETGIFLGLTLFDWLKIKAWWCKFCIWLA